MERGEFLRRPSPSLTLTLALPVLSREWGALREDRAGPCAILHLEKEIDHRLTSSSLLSGSLPFVAGCLEVSRFIYFICFKSVPCYFILGANGSFAFFKKSSNLFENFWKYIKSSETNM